MSLIGFLRVCDEFGLFPAIADFKTIQWLYESAEGWVKIETLRSRSRQLVRRTAQSSAGSAAASRGKKRRGSSRGPEIPRVDGFLFFGKWIKNHLAWLTKDFSSMGPSELKAACTLWAMSEWMEFRKLQVRDLFCLLDKDNSGIVTLDDLQIGIDFMSLDDPASAEDVVQLMRLIMPPPPTAIQVEEERPLQVEFNILGMALTAVNKQREHRDRAANVFLKDFDKMSRPESKAAIFFGGLWTLLEDRNWTPDQLFNEINLDGTGKVSQEELAGVTTRMMKLSASSKSTAAVSVDTPFELLDTNQDGIITRAEFTGVLEQVKQARDMKNLFDEVKHPIFLATTAYRIPLSKTHVFGLQAFVECLLKVGLTHLSYHGNSAQAEQPSFVKGMWMLLHMHSHFVKAQAKADEVSRVEAERGAPLTAQSAVKDTEEVRLPKCVMPMQRLLRFHPRLFVDAPEAPPALQPAPVVAPAASFGSSRPGTSASASQRLGSAGMPSRPLSRSGSAGLPARPATQEALYRMGWGRLADAALHKIIGDSEEGPQATGDRCLERALMAVATTGRC